MRKQIYVKYSNERDDKFKIKTIICKDENNKKWVQKVGLTPEAKNYVSGFERSYEGLKKLCEGTKFSLGQVNKTEDYTEFEYIDGKLFEEILDESIREKDYKKTVEIVLDFQKELEKISDVSFKLTDEFINIFGKPDVEFNGKALSYADIDLIFNNIIISSDNKWNIIDYEWSFGFPVPINFILYRAVFYYGTSDAERLYRKDIFDLGIFKLLGISDKELQAYRDMEASFQRYVTGSNNPLWDLYPMQKEYNVAQLIQKEKEPKFNDNIDVFYDYGEDFNGNDRDVIAFSENNVNNFVINVNNGIKRLRIDPGNFCCIVKMRKLRAIESNCYNLEMNHNGVMIDDDSVLFSTNDPQIIVNNIEPLTTKIEVEFEYEMLSIDAAIGLYKGLSKKEEYKIKQEQDARAIEELSAVVKSKDELIKNIENEYANLQKDNEDVKAEYASLQKNNEEIKAENEVLQKEKITLQKDNEDVKAEYASLQKDNEEIKAENEALQENNKQAKAENEALQRNNEQAKAEYSATIEEKDRIYNELLAQFADKNNQVMELVRRNGELEYNYNNILRSTCWKITKPIRVIFTPLKRFLAHNKYTSLFYKGLWSLKLNGVKNTMQRIKLWNLKRKMANNEELLSSAVIDSADNKPMAEIVPLERLNKKIAVHVHLYYADLLDEFISYLNNMPFKFDLFISTRKENNIKEITRKLKTITNVDKVDVRVSINRGRDIAPLYVQFGSEIEKYDYFLHVHTKKSLHSGKEQYGWRQNSLDCLLGSEEIVRKIFSLFENSEDKIGLFYPETPYEMHVIAQDWLANTYNGKVLLESMGIKFENGLFNYPVGSFFWARTDALRPIFDKKLKLEDFPEEAGQTDGTLAHALERVIAFVTKAQGYKMAIYDRADGNIAIGKSFKPYRSYFALNIENTKQYLSQFDLITFDVFDTLTTRCVYQPDDAFLLINKKIKKELGLDFDFLALRKEAEAVAWGRKQAYCSINDIYEDFVKVAKVSKKVAEKIKKLEIETELELAIPRKDMLEIFNYLKAKGKKIILISDMYLTSKEISKILDKCGYTGYDEIWVSCERGARKDTGVMWDKFFEAYGNYNTIHVGDNARSDIQITGDRGKATFFVMNPVVAFKLSSLYDRFKAYISTTVENSILLGLLVNGCLFNSPFDVDMRGEPIIKNPHELGYIGFSPLLTYFIHWVEETAQSNEELMFLAREGYLFEKIYDEYCKILGLDNSKGKYFLASRRAVSVAAIRSREDIESIIGQFYRGSLSNLLKVRLGIDLYPDMVDMEICMENDLGKVMAMLENHIDDIINRAELERNNYLGYIDEICDKRENIAVVDVGYSGTIQFYLAKLLDCKINGYYLSTSYNRKPEKLGCKCLSIYPIFSDDEIKVSKVFNKQLFLESALKAPFGQLIKFNNENGKLEPEYKDDSVISEQVVELQNGVVDFTKDYIKLVKSFTDKPELDKNLVEDIFDVTLSGNFSEETASLFSVQDDYCANGSQVFDVNEKKWKVVKNN